MKRFRCCAAAKKEDFTLLSPPGLFFSCIHDVVSGLQVLHAS